MKIIDKIIINNTIIALYKEYGYCVDETYYGNFTKKINVVKEHTKKCELSILLIDDILFVGCIDKHLFSVDLIVRLANLFNIKISLLES